MSIVTFPCMAAKYKRKCDFYAKWNVSYQKAWGCISKEFDQLILESKYSLAEVIVRHRVCHHLFSIHGKLTKLRKKIYRDVHPVFTLFFYSYFQQRWVIKSIHKASHFSVHKLPGAPMSLKIKFILHYG